MGLVGWGLMACRGDDGRTRDTGTLRLALAVPAQAGWDVARVAFEVTPTGLPGPLQARIRTPIFEPDQHGTGTLMVLVGGAYRVVARPLRSDGTPSVDCSAVGAEATVVPSSTTVLELSSRCQGRPQGGLDTVLTFKQAPFIQSLDFDRSKFICNDESVALRVRTTSSGQQPERITWKVSTWPEASTSSRPFCLIGSGARAGFSASAPGAYGLRVEAQNEAGTTAVEFPVYVSGCSEPAPCPGDRLRGRAIGSTQPPQGDACLCAPIHWAQARRSPRHTAFNEFELLLTANSVSRLRIAWEQTTREPGSLSPQSVSERGDQLFVNTHGSEEGALVALDRHTGGVLWRHGSSVGALEGTPAYDAGYVFVLGEEGLLGLHARRGTVRFREPLSSSDFRRSTPLASGAFVYVMGQRRELTESSLLLALRVRADSRLQVTLPLGNLRHPAAANGHIFVAGPKGVMSLAKDTTNRRWRASLEGPRFGPAILRGHVMVPLTDGVVALDEITGGERWRAFTMGEVVGHAAVTFDAVHVPTAMDGPGVRVESFDLQSGARRWASVVGTGELTGELGIAADVLYLGQSDGHLYALDVNGGRLLQAFDLQDGPVFSPVVTMGHVYVAGDSKVFALRTFE